MPANFTLGIEEEFQLVNRQTGQLQSYIEALLEKGQSLLGEEIKAEYFQSMVEVTTGVCPNIQVASRELRTKRMLLAQLVQEDGVMLISAGTHPSSPWQMQQRTKGAHYQQLEDHLQDLARSSVCFGLHIHVGMEDREQAIILINQLRTWIPHLLALSSNSPFIEGRMTGFKAYRPVLWGQVFARHGVTPGIFTSWADFEQYVENLSITGCITGSREICWDIRPNSRYRTIEFRICDMPATLDDTLLLVALCQALVAKLAWLYKQQRASAVLPREYIEENKLMAARDGLDAEIVDFVRMSRLSMRDALYELLDFVDDVIDDLGSRALIDRFHMLLASNLYKTGADRQLQIYQQTGDIKQVIQFLMDQTVDGIKIASR
jgi:carboxylate-amine ligase